MFIGSPLIFIFFSFVINLSITNSTLYCLFDENLGKLFKQFEKKKIIDDIMILITADHASYYPESPRKKLDVALRTHYEDLDIPLIMSNTTSKPKIDSMCDSMDLTATFIKQLGIIKQLLFC